LAINHNNSPFSETRFNKRLDSNDQQSFLLRCRSLSGAPFEIGSQLSQLAKEAFYQSGLTLLHLPASVTVIGEFCFSDCRSLASITFDPASKFRGSAADLLTEMRLGVTEARQADEFFDD
jgi:hypothetical protein